MDVSYRYKQQVVDPVQRKEEGLKARRMFPAKVPVSKLAVSRPIDGPHLPTCVVGCGQVGRVRVS